MDTQYLRNLSNRIVTGIENPEIPFINYALSFLSIIFIRLVLENFSQRYYPFNLENENFFFGKFSISIWFIVAAMIFSILLHYATNVEMKKVLRFTMTSMILIMLAPLFDLVISLGQGSTQNFIMPAEGLSLLHEYLTFASSSNAMTAGMRIEISLILLTCFLYFRTKGCSVAKSVFCVLVGYSLLFVWGAAPFIIWMFDLLMGRPFNMSNIQLSGCFLMIMFCLLVWVSYLLNRKLFVALLGDLRSLRVIYYELTFILGAAIAFSVVTPAPEFMGFINDGTPFRLVVIENEFVILKLALMMVAILFAGIFSLMINNISDIEIDRVSNPDRPLIKGYITVSTCHAIAFFSLAMALLYSFFIGPKAGLVIAVMMGVYYLYSAMPLRLKRIPVLSKLAISFNSIILLLMGYLIVRGNQSGFPTELFAIYLVGITLSSNFIDLKDIAGDKAAGIMTLPILLGERIAKIIIGAALFFVTISFYVLFNRQMLIPLFVLTGALLFYVVNMRDYKDWRVILLSDATLAGMIILLLYFRYAA